MKRRCGTAALITICVCWAIPSGAIRTTNPQAVSCLVTTPSGDVQGVDQGASCAFLGIPFAAPPIDGLRWRPPQPAAPWAPTTLTANVIRQCPQYQPGRFAGRQRGGLPGTEHLGASHGGERSSNRSAWVHTPRTAGR